VSLVFRFSDAMAAYADRAVLGKGKKWPYSHSNVWRIGEDIDKKDGVGFRYMANPTSHDCPLHYSGNRLNQNQPFHNFFVSNFLFWTVIAFFVQIAKKIL
jgi:Thermolysin metallopeptidase, alpha-helical domain